MPEIEPVLQGWLLAVLAASAGLAVGTMAVRWKRRNALVWMLYGGVTFGAAALVLAGLPRLERRHQAPEREQRANWHA